jgi:iron(III) transport system permease protein
VGSIVGIGAVAITSLWIVRSGSRAAQLLDTTIKFPAMLSHLVIAVGFVLAFGGLPFNLGGTALIMVLAYLALYIPQASVTSDAAVAQIGKELPEASRVAGASEGRTIARIYLPLMAPALVVGWSMLFVRMIGDLTASSILAGTRNNVVGFRILEIYQNGSYAALASLSTALTVLSAVIVIVVLIISRRLARWSNPSLGGS